MTHIDHLDNLQRTAENLPQMRNKLSLHIQAIVSLPLTTENEIGLWAVCPVVPEPHNLP